MEKINMTLDFNLEKYHIPEVFLLNLSLVAELEKIKISEERFNKKGIIQPDLKDNQINITFLYDQNDYANEGKFYGKLIALSAIHDFDVPFEAMNDVSELFNI